MILGNLINLGVKSELEFYEKREVRMINLFCWIALFGSVAGIMTVFLISTKYPTAIAIFSVAADIGPLLLNFKSYYNIATYLFVFTTNFSLFLEDGQENVAPIFHGFLSG